jgi:hypothetical protein
MGPATARAKRVAKMVRILTFMLSSFVRWEDEVGYLREFGLLFREG